MFWGCSKLAETWIWCSCFWEIITSYYRQLDIVCKRLFQSCCNFLHHLTCIRKQYIFTLPGVCSTEPALITRTHHLTTAGKPKLLVVLISVDLALSLFPSPGLRTLQGESGDLGQREEPMREREMFPEVSVCQWTWGTSFGDQSRVWWQKNGNGKCLVSFAIGNKIKKTGVLKSSLTACYEYLKICFHSEF